MIRSAKKFARYLRHTRAVSALEYAMYSGRHCRRYRHRSVHLQWEHHDSAQRYRNSGRDSGPLNPFAYGSRFLVVAS